ncbi:MAG: hypothetical protein IJ877_06065 [Candidatus Gastranaerophilales bacterium]|nr:hypothetical protein [Candidatus Gastranaerophilales bacterium]
MPVIPKIAGTASIIASLYDIHKTAMIYSKQEYNKAMGDTVVASSIGNQKADNVSFKDAQRKNWTAKHHFLSNANETIASVKGYVKGAVQGIIRYIPKFALATLAIIPKTRCKTLAYLSTVALAGMEAWDFLRHGTGLFERTDYLERK